MNKEDFLKTVHQFETNFYEAPALMGEYEDFYFCDEEFTINFDPNLYDTPIEACAMFYGALLDVYNINGWDFNFKAGFDDAKNLAYIEKIDSSDNSWVSDMSILSGFDWAISSGENSRAYFMSDEEFTKNFFG